ncbi:MAG TPA: ester cyclase [Gaiellaceae bacterium]|nr:ester cyclase [Gaiellaceae bacterium]
MTMDNKEISRSYFARITSGDLDVVTDLFTLDFVDHDAPPGTPAGPEAAKAFAGAMISHHPDLKIEVEDIFGEDDRVALRLHWNAEQTGYVQYGIVVFRFEGDRIAERWSAYMSAA